MKTYIVTTTNTSAHRVMLEVLRVDRTARLQYTPGNPTVFRIRAKAVSILTLEAIDGVAQAYEEFEHNGKVRII